MSDEITFLPALRRGLAQTLTNADPLRGALPRGPAVPVSVTVAGTRVTQSVRVAGPDQVIGIAASQILRREPQPDAVDVEPSSFPLVELARPDLPWAYTPADAASRGRLRPWVVLVVVREADGVSVEPASGGPLPVLRIAAPAVPADELPDLADSWGWAHVQSLVGPDVHEAVEAHSGEVVGRLLCPRRLEPRSGYLACLVPAFDGGVASGLGQAPVTADVLGPAWDVDRLGPSIALPVYDHWRFTTGAGGDFEALCRRLGRDDGGAEMGLRALDITAPGLVAPAPRPVLVDYEGALFTMGARPRPWAQQHRMSFQDDLFPLLAAGAGRTASALPPRGSAYNPRRDDPVVAPPLYGGRPAGVTAVPADGWVRLVNDHPARRAAAGLGARVVRALQEELVAAAWDAAGDLRATGAALNQGRLAAEIGRSWTRRAETLPDADLLRLTLRQQAFLAEGGASMRARLAASAVPAGLSSPTHGRLVRAGTPLARDWSRRTPSGRARLGADHVEMTLGATGDPALVAALGFVAARRVSNAQTVDRTLDQPPPAPGGRVASDPARAARRARALRTIGRAATEVGTDPRPGGTSDLPHWPAPSGDDVSTIADAVRTALDPVAAVRASVLDRVPALVDLLGPSGLPTSVPAGPVYGDALCWDLLALGAAWLLPGVGRLGANRVRLVETNPDFVGAFLIGANHELNRELAWRGYPVDPRATAFHRFWSYLDPGRADIEDLEGWRAHRTIAENVLGSGEPMTVFVVRADLVRRYPTAHWYLQQAELVGGVRQPLAGVVQDVTFVGSLDTSTIFLGFDRPPAEVRGDVAAGDAGWYLVVEEQPGAPRFGLDVAAAADFREDPTSWDDVSWGHLVPDRTALDALTHARTDAPRLTALGELGGAVWGHSSAHLARITWQRPFRMLLHAGELI